MKRRTFVGSIMAICPAAMASVAPAPNGGLKKYDVLVVAAAISILENAPIGNADIHKIRNTLEKHNAILPPLPSKS